MRIKLSLVISFLFLTFGVPANGQSPNRDSELTQAKEINSKVVELFKQRRFKEALPLAQRVLEIRQRYLSRDDASLGAAFSNLGELYFELKKDPEAEEAFQQALSVYEKKSDSALIARTLERMAHLLFRKRDYEKAEPFYVRSLEIKEKEFGATNPQTIAAMKDYACLSLIVRGGRNEPEDKDDPKTGLRARALCWLGGFHDNCADTGKVRTEGIVNGKARFLAQPEYPIEARQKHLSGKVFVAILGDKDGNVIKARAICGGPPELISAVGPAAYASKFVPAKRNDKPIHFTGIIIYKFVQ